MKELPECNYTCFLPEQSFAITKIKTMELSMLIKFSSHVHFRRFDQRAKVISFELDEYLLMNGPFVSLLDMIQEGRRLEELMHELKTHTKFDHDILEKSLQDFINHLCDWGLLGTSISSSKQKKFVSPIGEIEAFTYQKTDYDVSLIRG